jgi:hypothetical protein
MDHQSVGGLTDGGFGSFDTEFSAAALLANGTINWQATYMFGKPRTTREVIVERC